MKPNCCWAFLHVSTVALMLLTLNAGSEDCYSEIKVRRDTTYKTIEGRDLVINCTVVFCNSSPSSVSWFKVEPNVPVDLNNQSHIKSEWKELKTTEGIFYLTFQKIRSNDSGLYQCRIGSDTIGHSINVTVLGGEEPITWKNNTNSTNSDPSPKMMYVYSAAGISAFVFLVITVSIIAMQGCRGKSRKQTQSENKYAAIPMVEDLSPSDQSNVLTPQRHNKCVHREANQQDTGRTRTAGEDGGSVVYAALNHQLPPAAAPRSQRKQEEPSVYAAIRIS